MYEALPTQRTDSLLLYWSQNYVIFASVMYIICHQLVTNFTPIIFCWELDVRVIIISHSGNSDKNKEMPEKSIRSLATKTYEKRESQGNEAFAHIRYMLWFHNFILKLWHHTKCNDSNFRRFKSSNRL